tara:strand:- start:327 stop:821 length:495 start_codon:yes stop_codon:yes gene_type:complete
MLSSFFNKNPRINIWKKVYNENPNDFNSRLTKVYEIISITTAIMSGLSVSFMGKTNEDNIPLLIVSTLAICLSLFTLIFSIIIITMTNATETKNYLIFIEDWSGSFIFPVIGVILSSTLTLVSLLLYIPYEIRNYILPIVIIGILIMLIFYCKIRTAIFNYSNK